MQRYGCLMLQKLQPHNPDPRSWNRLRADFLVVVRWHVGRPRHAPCFTCLVLESWTAIESVRVMIAGAIGERVVQCSRHAPCQHCQGCPGRCKGSCAVVYCTMTIGILHGRIPMFAWVVVVVCARLHVSRKVDGYDTTGGTMQLNNEYCRQL